MGKRGGPAAALRARLLDPQARSPRSPGRGIGLDVVANVVNRVGGEVFLDSEPGRGHDDHASRCRWRAAARPSCCCGSGSSGSALPALGGAPRHPARSADRSSSATAGTIAALPRHRTGWCRSCRWPGSTASRAEDDQLLLEGMVSGQPLALAVDDVEGEQEVLVRPITRKVATDRLLEGRGAPRLGRAGGRAVAGRAGAARVPARPAGRRASRSWRREACASSWWTTRWSRARWSAACWRTPASTSRPRATPRRRWRCSARSRSTAWSPTSRCRAWTASS